MGTHRGRRTPCECGRWVECGTHRRAGRVKSASPRHVRGKESSGATSNSHPMNDADGSGAPHVPGRRQTCTSSIVLRLEGFISSQQDTSIVEEWFVAANSVRANGQKHRPAVGFCLQPSKTWRIDEASRDQPAARGAITPVRPDDEDAVSPRSAALPLASCFRFFLSSPRPAHSHTAPHSRTQHSGFSLKVKRSCRPLSEGSRDGVEIEDLCFEDGVCEER